MSARQPAKALHLEPWRLSVAPMLDWTDSICRQFHRQFSRHALLYTEMVTSAALVRGDARHLLRFDPVEHPVALQLGGSDPAELIQATRMGADEGYDEINLNVGCPSDRVQSGCFGAVLMKQPGHVADIVRAMQSGVADHSAPPARPGRGFGPKTSLASTTPTSRSSPAPFATRRPSTPEDTARGRTRGTRMGKGG